MRVIEKLKERWQWLVRVAKKHTVCMVAGHLSTGTMLWWMCNRCCEDFKHNAEPSQWINGVKVTHSPAFRKPARTA